MAAAALVGCSSDEDINNPVDIDKPSITVSKQAFTFEDGTRTSYTLASSGIDFSWDTSSDVLGIFPESTGNDQMSFPLTNGNTSGKNSLQHTLIFDEIGFDAVDGETYIAYYPYNGKLTSSSSYTDIPFNISGQDGTLSNLSNYDYMWSSGAIATKIEDEWDIDIIMNQLCSVIQFQLTMPEAATLQSLTISNDNNSNVFTTAGTFNAQTGAITATASSSSYTLNLSNVTASENEVVTLYMLVAPTTTGEVTIQVTSSDQSVYSTTASSKTFNSGKAYRYIATMTKN